MLTQGGAGSLLLMAHQSGCRSLTCRSSYIPTPIRTVQTAAPPWYARPVPFQKIAEKYRIISNLKPSGIDSSRTACPRKASHFGFWGVVFWKLKAAPNRVAFRDISCVKHPYRVFGLIHLLILGCWVFAQSLLLRTVFHSMVMADALIATKSSLGYSAGDFKAL